jgi:hypothetical protein
VSGALSTKEGRPLTHATKWDDISPQGQAYLLELECVTHTLQSSWCRQWHLCCMYCLISCTSAWDSAVCSSMLQSCRKIVAQYREESRQLDDNPRLWGDEGRTLKQVGAAPAEGLPQQLGILQCVVNPGPRA